jgi:3-isopropylmalate dehydrogenase
MMLRYSLNLSKEADAVEAAVKNAIETGLRTADLKGTATTTNMGDAIVKELVAVLTS